MGGDVFRDEHSLAFDGSNDAVLIGDTTVWDGLDDLTISAWIKVDSSASGVNPILCKGTYNNSAAAFHFNIGPDTSNGRIRFSVSNSVYAYRNNCITAHGFTLDSWNHVAVTYSNTDDEIYFYINGTQISPGSEAGTYASIPANTAPSRIASDDGTNFFQGNISEIATYNSALTASQVKTIYNGREPYNHKEGTISGNLLTWWRMGDDERGVINKNDAEGGLVLDSSKSGGVLSSNLMDAAASIFTSGTYGWTAYNSNTIENDSNSLKVTGDGSNVNGAYVYFRDAKDLSTDLVVGAMYKFTVDAKVNAGKSVNLNIVTPSTSAGSDNHVIQSVTNTSFETFSTVFMAGSTTNAYFRVNDMQSGDIIWIDNMILQRVQGNGTPGVLQNMDINDWVKDTPWQ